jgi:hypothetical protein
MTEQAERILDALNRHPSVKRRFAEEYLRGFDKASLGLLEELFAIPEIRQYRKESDDIEFVQTFKQVMERIIAR